jgi:hypothetical protein
MSSHRASVTRENTLSKVGAALRWFLEREGIDPESCVVSIGVCTSADAQKLMTAFLREFDEAMMFRRSDVPPMVIAHGVPLCVMVKKEHA